METEGAEAVGISALQFIAGEPDLMNRFLALSGFAPADLRQAAQQPAFFAGLLDFLLAHEPSLMAFCERSGTAPETVSAARTALGNGYSEVPR